MTKTYGLNWIEIARRSLAFIAFAWLASFFFLFFAKGAIAFNIETFFSGALLLILIAAGLWLLRDIFNLFWQYPRIDLQERGVTLITRDSELDWDWDEFTNWSGKLTYHKLYGVITLYISGACEFYSNDKPPLRIRGTFKDAPKLAGIIITQIMMTQLPKQIEAFHQGKTLEFGSVTLNKEGLYYRDTFIPFDDMTSVGMNRDYFFVHLKSQPKNPTRLDQWKMRMPELLLAVMHNLFHPSQ